MTRRRRTTWTALAALAAALLTPVLNLALTAEPASAAASTDAIVYLKDGKVWIAHADGTGAHAFTKGSYDWSSPSEDDHGNVVVLGGLARTNPDGSESVGSTEIYRFAPDGNQIGKPIPTWGSYSTWSCPSFPPTSARVSPDGTKVAYGIWSCGAADNTTLWTPVTSTSLNFPGQSLGQSDYYQPQWVDNTRFVVSHTGPTVTETQARWYVHGTGQADSVGPGWYDNRITGTGAQSVISRDGKTFAVFEDDAADYLDGKPRHVRLWLYSSPDLATAIRSGWSLSCTVPLPAGSTTHPQQLSPSFSSDGTRLYWGDDNGIEVASIADRSSSCANVHPTLLVPGGAQPFVSRGGVHALAPEPVQPGVQYRPHALFQVTTPSPTVGHATAFDGSASHETLGRIVRYRWTFGDGASGGGRTTTHVYQRHGTFQVRLVVTDDRGVTAAVTHSVTIT